MLQLHNWCCANKLEINPTKSVAIIIPVNMLMLIALQPNRVIRCDQKQRQSRFETHLGSDAIPVNMHDVQQDLNILYNNQNIACCNTSKYLEVITN